MNESKAEIAARDSERLFGVLQGRFGSLRRVKHEWSDSSLVRIVHMFVIIHNILVCLLRHGELSDEIDAHDNFMSAQEILEEYNYPDSAQNLNLGDHGVLDMAENRSVGIADLSAAENTA